MRRNQKTAPPSQVTDSSIPLVPHLTLFQAVPPPEFPGIFIEGSTQTQAARSRIRITLSPPGRRIKYINIEILLYTSKVILVLLLYVQNSYLWTI